MAVRQIALSRFGLHNLPVGAPVSTLEVRLLPLYLLHRYQIAAAAKWIGGADFTYAIRTATGTSPATPFQIVPAERQREALAALLTTLDPSVLTLPPALLAMLPPTAFGYDGGPSEHFDSHETPFFDPLAVASIAADLTVSALLQPERAARLVDFHARDSKNPDFTDVVSALVGRTFAGGTQARPEDLALRRTIQYLVVTRLIALASNVDASFAVRQVRVMAFVPRRSHCRRPAMRLAPPFAKTSSVTSRARKRRRRGRRHLRRRQASRSAEALLLFVGHCRRRRGRLGVVEDEDFLARSHVAEVAAGRFLDRRRVLAEATSLGLQPLVLGANAIEVVRRAPRTRGGPASSPTGRLRRRATRRRASAPQARGRFGSGG